MLSALPQRVAPIFSRAWAALPGWNMLQDRHIPTRQQSYASYSSETIPEHDIFVGSDIPEFLGQEYPDYGSIDGMTGVKVPRTSERGQLQKAPFQDRLTFFMLLVLGMPAISCAWMARNPSVTYWMGQSGLLMPAGVMLWVLLGHDLLSRKVVDRRLGAIVVLVLPIMALLITAHVHKLSALDKYERLKAEDCKHFPGKVRVEQAWQEANKIFDSCVEFHRNLSHAPLRELRLVTEVQNCAGYEVGARSWGGEWAYLEELERSQRCAGWCTVERPLWHNMVDYKPRDRCSAVAADILRGEVYRTARQVVFYCILSLMFICVFFSLVEI